ncbi:uncharacterized protein LOC141904317 [Tubulanus polymorphus]|uniref:uncharacterized protein LOC141904317 n=1 Tax=Tubulanus polymorphus TaxID=672921 RepID=UPI003DA46D3C
MFARYRRTRTEEELFLPLADLLSALELCRRNAGWDDELLQSEREIWATWLQSIQRVNKLRIRRCYNPCNFGEVEQCQLHCFADASESGYGVATYMRTTDSQGNVSCMLVLGKSRVAPLKVTTIPRLELTAALTAVKLSLAIIRELDIKVDDLIYWTDSKVVLGYLRNETARYRTFVANRVSAIREGSDISNWRYVNTELNPADDASRGFTIIDEQRENRWFNGPSFLYESEENWPIDCEIIGTECDSEVKHCGVTSVTEESDAQPKQIVEAALIKLKVKRPSVKSLEIATEVLIRCQQRKYYSDEFESLKKDEKKRVKRCSPLHKFDTFIDESGILRVGGRTSRASVPFEARHPIILPKLSHLSRLLIRETHADMGHLGKQAVLSKLRENYWIQGGPGLVKSILGKCVPCRKYQGRLCQQKMADLPSERLAIREPPFSCTGVDYFGPFVIKHKRFEVKRYGVIFTCLFVKNDLYVHKRWRSVQYLTDQFWRRWLAEYFPLLQERQKWQSPKRNVQINDVVLLADSGSRHSWAMGRVIETYPDSIGLVRSVKVKTFNNELVRPIHKLVLLLEAE